MRHVLCPVEQTNILPGLEIERHDEAVNVDAPDPSRSLLPDSSSSSMLQQQQ
jgi:hypothetical protein